MNSEEKEILIELLADTFDEEIHHLRLRCIRDDQAPRFAVLKESHPEITADFLKARGVHDKLRDERRQRIRVLTELIEGAAPAAFRVGDVVIDHVEGKKVRVTSLGTDPNGMRYLYHDGGKGDGKGFARGYIRNYRLASSV